MKKILSSINLFDFFAMFAVCQAIYLHSQSKSDHVVVMFLAAVAGATIFSFLEGDVPDIKASQWFMTAGIMAFLLMGYTMYIQKNLVVVPISLVIAVAGSILLSRIYPVRITGTR